MAIVDMVDFKEYMKIQHDHEDVLIEGLLTQASEAAANWCRTQFEWGETPEPVKLAVMIYAGYQYEHRSEPDEKGYKAMYRAFTDLLSSYSDPEKEF